MSLTREVNGRPVSAADLTRWELTRREYEHFLAVYAQSTHANGTLPVETDGASDAFVAGQPRREPANGRS
jgi:hypothetical protein